MKNNKFEILTARDHTRKRPGMFLGSVSLEAIDRFILGKWRTTSYVPALLKMVDEIIDNAVDEAIRTDFKFANDISVTVDSKKVIVSDNGRGIPNDEVLDKETGQRMSRPLAAWTRIRAGTNFEDDRVTIGANGVGSACVNFMSMNFTGTTINNGQKVTVKCENGALDTDVSVRKSKAPVGTMVEFSPDFSLFGVNGFSEGDHLALIKDRLLSLQMAFPEIKFKLNGSRVGNESIKKYGSMFVSDDANMVTVQRDMLSFFFASSEDGFRTTGYVNGVNTRYGGAYNDFVVNSVVEILVSNIKRKYKVDVGKSTIKNGLIFVLFAREFVDPQFDSQTKERLTNTQGQVNKHYKSSGALPFDQISKKIMACEDIIEPIVEAEVAKKAAADKRLATLAQKKLKKAKVQKHVEATGDKDTCLRIVEGNSAVSFGINVRNPETTGFYPLKGVVLNTWNEAATDVLKNKELSELIAVLNLDIGDPDSIDRMAYDKVATLTDADHDGNHITGLLIAFFYKFWPRLFTEERIMITRTPIMISTKGKKIEWFYSYEDAHEFKNKNPDWYHRHIKGLASLTEEEYDSIINDPVFDIVSIDNAAWLQVMFSDDPSLRKKWLRNEEIEILE